MMGDLVPSRAPGFYERSQDLQLPEVEALVPVEAGDVFETRLLSPVVGMKFVEVTLAVMLQRDLEQFHAFFQVCDQFLDTDRETFRHDPRRQSPARGCG